MSNTAHQALPAPACIGCGSTTAELIDGYCDERLECAVAGRAIELAREQATRECAERLWANGCVCSNHVGV